MRELADIVSTYQEPSAATAERYRRIAKAMLADSKQIGSIGGFAEARAALVHHAVTTAKEILDVPEADWTPAMRQATREARAFLSLFPPGGGSGHVYHGPRSTKAQRKRRVRNLDPDWRSRLFAAALQRFPGDATAVAIVELTGLRRAELAMGVTIRRCLEGLHLTIRGAKVNESRGQPLREIVTSFSHPRALWLAERLNLSIDGSVIVQLARHRLNYVIASSAREAFPSLPEDLLPTPKTYRDQLSADLKKSCPPLEVAIVLGHLAERSQNAYAGPRHARGPINWIAEASASREIKTLGDPRRFGRPIVSTGADRPPVQSYPKGVA